MPRFHRGSVESTIDAARRMKSARPLYIFPTADGLSIADQPPPFNRQHYIVDPDGTVEYIPSPYEEEPPPIDWSAFDKLRQTQEGGSPGGGAIGSRRDLESQGLFVAPYVSRDEFILAWVDRFGEDPNRPTTSFSFKELIDDFRDDYLTSDAASLEDYFDDISGGPSDEYAALRGKQPTMKRGRRSFQALSSNGDLEATVRELARRVGALEQREQVEPWHNEGAMERGATIDDWYPKLVGPSGIVTDEAVARATPCIALDLGENRELVFSKGIVGALDEGQKALYCPETSRKEASTKTKERLRSFKEAAAACEVLVDNIPNGERLGPWRSCMGKELRARGIMLVEESE